jgi:hypothetical protein
MKIRYLLALVGLAISFAVPTFAQEKVDQKAWLDYLAKFDVAFNNNDAAALAALFTKNAVIVTDGGPFYGREAIEKWYADLFKNVHFSNHILKPDQYSPHVIGAAGYEVWSNGERNHTWKPANGEGIGSDYDSVYQATGVRPVTP